MLLDWWGDYALMILRRCTSLLVGGLCTYDLEKVHFVGAVQDWPVRCTPSLSALRRHAMLKCLRRRRYSC